MPALPSGQTTVLLIDTIGIPLYSCRNVRQTLTPIGAASYMRRTVNGELIDLSPTQFRKYKSSISCSDNTPPAFDGIWPGLIVNVSCAKELGYITSGGSPKKTVVDGSSRVDGAFTFYRPLITFRIVNWSDNYTEWEVGDEWQLDLEEV